MNVFGHGCDERKPIRPQIQWSHTYPGNGIFFNFPKKFRRNRNESRVLICVWKQITNKSSYLSEWINIRVD